jgi:hypothetical protein
VLYHPLAAIVGLRGAAAVPKLGKKKKEIDGPVLAVLDFNSVKGY